MINLPLQDLAILVLEDEFLIAMDIEEVCISNGAARVSIVSRITGGPGTVLDGGTYDAAVLDLKLDEHSTLPVARHLTRGGVPFIFATGYLAGESELSEFPDVPVISKPFAPQELVAALARAVRAGALRDGG